MTTQERNSKFYWTGITKHEVKKNNQSLWNKHFTTTSK